MLQPMLLALTHHLLLGADVSHWVALVVCVRVAWDCGHGSRNTESRDRKRNG